jgi:hypothetical protein
MNNLHGYLGITEEQFASHIKPLMDGITASGMKVDMALLKIEQDKKLSTIEKVYCSYCIGRVVGIDEVNKRSLGLAKRLGLS